MNGPDGDGNAFEAVAWGCAVGFVGLMLGLAIAVIIRWAL